LLLIPSAGIGFRAKPNVIPRRFRFGFAACIAITIALFWVRAKNRFVLGDITPETLDVGVISVLGTLGISMEPRPLEGQGIMNVAWNEHFMDKLPLPDIWIGRNAAVLPIICSIKIQTKHAVTLPRAGASWAPATWS